MSAAYSSFSRSPQSGSRGPAFTVKSGIFCIVLFVPSSCTSVRDIMPSLRLCQRKATIHANGTDHLCSASPVARAAEKTKLKSLEYPGSTELNKPMG